MTVPHPGPRPAEFVFPFAVARSALEAIERLIDALTATGQAHDAAAADVGRGFEGDSRDAFERWLGDALEDLRSDRARLDDDAEHLRSVLADAQQRQANREAAIAAWHRAHAAYREDQRAQAALRQLGVQ